MTKDLLRQIADRNGVDPLDLVLDYLSSRKETPDRDLVSFEMAHVEDSACEDDDTVLRYFIDGYPAGEDAQGAVVATVSLTRSGDVVVDWHHNGYRLNGSVLDLVTKAKSEISGAKASSGGKKTYVAAFAVNGRYYAHVTADGPGDAVNQGNLAVQEADFGELETVDWTLDHVEDQDGNILDGSEINGGGT